MEAATWLNALAITISVSAVLTSVWFGARQVRTAQQANHLPAYMELLAEFRRSELHDQYTYVCSELRNEHPVSCGLRGLPVEARSAVYNIAYFFQTLASLYAIGVIDETTAVIMVRGRAAKVWSAVQPYVEREREFPDVDPDLLSLLETFAILSTEFQGPSAAELLLRRHQRSRLRVLLPGRTHRPTHHRPNRNSASP